MKVTLMKLIYGGSLQVEESEGGLDWPTLSIDGESVALKVAEAMSIVGTDGSSMAVAPHVVTAKITIELQIEDS